MVMLNPMENIDLNEAHVHHCVQYKSIKAVMKHNEEYLCNGHR